MLSVPLPGLFAYLLLEEREVLLERPPGHGWTAAPEQPAALGLPAADVGAPRSLMTLMQHAFSPISVIRNVSRALNERCVETGGKYTGVGFEVSTLASGDTQARAGYRRSRRARHAGARRQRLTADGSGAHHERLRSNQTMDWRRNFSPRASWEAAGEARNSRVLLTAATLCMTSTVPKRRSWSGGMPRVLS